MKTIGLTGNIGSGKTTVAKVFNAFGFTILDADFLAKQLYLQPEIKQQVETVLACSILNDDQSINFARIAEQYFRDKGVYQDVNRILYPALKLQIEKEIASAKTPVLIEAAMLFEAGLDALVDYKITVTAPLELRMQRVQRRNGMSREQFLERESLQFSEQYKEEKADAVINNSGQLSVVEQVQRVAETITMKQ